MMATAPASGVDGTPVQTLALTMMSSATAAGAPFRQAGQPTERAGAMRIHATRVEPPDTVARPQEIVD
jgi:hypothetical protein